MVKHCIAAGCSNTNADGVSLFRFLRNPSLCVQWNKQVQELVPIGKKQPSILFFVMSILQMTASKKIQL